MPLPKPSLEQVEGNCAKQHASLNFTFTGDAELPTTNTQFHLEDSA